MKDAKDLIPWEVTDISTRPFDGYWSFNPSIHFDGGMWLCVQRCCDYAMPDGITIRSKGARPVGQQTKNAMIILDPGTWKPIQIYKMHERDDLPRASTPHVGYEDMRLFKTDAGGLQGIAASLHLRRGARPTDGLFQQPSGPQNQPPEQVLLSFDGEYNIVSAQPIRGDGWSGTPQKNWVPFDGCVEPRFLYSIGKGTMFDAGGSVHGDRALVRPSIRSPLAILPVRCAVPPPLPPPLEAVEPGGKHVDRPVRPRRPDLRMMIRGGDMQIVRGKRGGSVPPSSQASPRSTPRPATSTQAPSRSAPRPATIQGGSGGEATRVMGTGRMLLPRYEGLRGGTQLVRIDADAWLGIGHEMKFVGGKKYYWHVWYMVDSRGKMTAASEPMKLAPNGIEFAAGMAIDGDRVVVSFGVDDMACRLGETRLSAVMAMLQKMDR
jgi:hypothetical protein